MWSFVGINATFVLITWYLYSILKFTKDSYWLKSGIFSLLQNFSNLIFGFGGFYLLVRVLDKDQMGTWVLFTIVTSMLEVARIGFIKYGFIKLRAEAKPEDHGKLLTASLTLNVILHLWFLLECCSSVAFLPKHGRALN